MTKRIRYWVIRILGVVLGIFFLLVAFLTISQGDGTEMWVGPLMGIIFVSYGLFGQHGLKRLVSFLIWPLFFPMSLAFLAWSSLQLWYAASRQLIRAWPYSDVHLWSNDPVNFSIIVGIHLFVLLQVTGFLYMLWLSIECKRGSHDQGL